MATLDLAEAFETGKYSDITIIAADGQEFNVHGVIISSACQQLLDFGESIGWTRRRVPESGAVMERVCAWLRITHNINAYKADTAFSA